MEKAAEFKIPEVLLCHTGQHMPILKSGFGNCFNKT